MSTLKVNTIEPYSGGTVTITGGTIASASYAVTASFALNAGGGSDLSSYTGSINQTGGTTNLNGELTVQGANINLPYDGTQRTINVNVSGSENYTIGGFDYNGLGYGQIYSTALGGFQLTNASATGSSNLGLQSDNGSIFLTAPSGSVNTNLGGFYGVTTTNGQILLVASGNNAARMGNAATRQTVYSGGVQWIPSPGSVNTFYAGISQDYGLNLFNSTYTQDVGFCLNIDEITGIGPNKVGFWSNYGAAYEALISFQDADNYTDGSIEFHQAVSGSNVTLSDTLTLTPQSPLPTGKVGDLAVSGSALYFFDGAWKTVSLV